VEDEMAEKLEHDSQDRHVSSSPGRGDPEAVQRPPPSASPSLRTTVLEPPAPVITEPPRNDRTLEAGGTAARVIARALESRRSSGEQPTTPPTSSDRLAVLAAHLPRVPRDAYAVGNQVARGGIGRVMRARDQRLDRPVAIKELLVWNEAQEERFVREALLTARLQHPAIVPVYEAGRWPDGEPFYTMKLVSGRTLSDLIGEKKTLAERLALLPHVITVAQAVAYAHTQRILHRDLKPANVLVGEFGETVVIDWGLAKGLTEVEGSSPGDGPGLGGAPRPAEGIAISSPATGQGLTIEGAVVGTPAYMPPEQAAGKPVDERADIYAIGAILYHLIAAVAPYHDVPWEKMLATIAAEPPRPVERFAPSISDELCAIIHKAMARDPAARYPTAKALAEDLERFQTGHIVAAHTYSARQLLARFWRRNRTALSVAAGALSLVALVIAGAFARTESERRFALAKKQEAEEAPKAADALRAEAVATEHKSTARADELTMLQAHGALARDPNEAIAWLKTLSPSFTDAVEMRNLAADAHARGISRVFRGHAAHVNSVTVLPGGKRFVTMSDDKTVRVWDTGTGEPRLLLGHTDEVWFAAAFPDGERIVTVAKDVTARIWNVTSGAELARARLPEGAQQVAVRADGAVVGSPNPFAGSPWVWEPGAAEVRPLAAASEKVTSSGVSEDGRRAILRLEDGSVFGVDTESGKRSAAGKGVAGRTDNRWGLSGNGRIAVRSVSREQEVTEVEVWDVDAGTFDPVRVPGLVGRLTLSKTGDRAAFAGPDHIFEYDVKTKALARRFGGHGSTLYSAKLSDDGQTLITGGYDRAVRVWSFLTGESRTYAGVEGTVSWVTFWSDQRSILAASSAGDVRLFEPGRAGATLTHHRAPTNGLALSADGRVASLDDRGLLRINDLDGKLHAEHALGASPTWHLVPSQDRRRFAALWWDPKNNIKAGRKSELVSARTDLVIGTFDEAKPTVVTLPSPILRVAWAPAGDMLFASLLDGTVQKVQLDRTVTEVDRSPEPVICLAVSPDAAWLAEGVDDGVVRLTELATGRHEDLGKHADRVLSIVFSEDSKTLATGSLDHTFRLWTVEGGAVRSFVASGGGVFGLAFGADRKTLFVNNLQESFLRRWSLETGEELPRLMGHGGPISGFSVSADGSRMVTTASDRTARIFDLATGKSRALGGHKDGIAGALFASDGNDVITLARDGAVRRWPDDLPKTIPELRTWLESATPDRVKGH
jgi:WD40 repeat protein/serine/threonine protein kinase